MGFQSSPVANDGCNAAGSRDLTRQAIEFQSSPVANDGCNVADDLVRGVPAMFQSSPVANDGCNIVGFLSSD